ncbi:MAG TPA: PucR family transcriptional regulator ligand-binding domain-containing protein [Streptosporangiaceae bacterium]|nr:PucR family transcriptional regulator ligand-binding domain-containing protein [Streptosporangiaceae bacterium]
MSITVRELLQLPHLQVTLIAGADGLDREISWVHTSDLPNPWEWHGTGELLLTNGTGMPPEELAQINFVEKLCEAGASGLALGLGMSGPPLTVGATRKADELGLPLLGVPFSVPFTAVVRAVADANDREESRQLRRVARLYELLRASVVSAQPGPETLRKLGQELGIRLYLVDPETGLSLFGEGEETSFGSALVESYLAHRNAIPGMLRLNLPGAAPGNAGAVAVAVPGDQPTALVVEPLGNQLPSPVLLQHIATGAALELAQLVTAREQQRRQGADLLSQMIDRRVDPRVAYEQVTDAGLDLSTCVLVMADVGRQVTATDLHRVLVRTRVPYLLLRRDCLLYVAIPDLAVEAHFPAELPEPAHAVGISGPVISANRVPDATQEARWALGVAEMEKRPVVRFGDDTTLLLPRTPTEAQALVSRILGGLITLDAEHGTDYVNTLQVMLRHNRSWQSAAAELHIHKQTLGYRIRKIEQITGRGLTRTEDLAEWWFALRAHDLLDGRQRT